MLSIFNRRKKFRQSQILVQTGGLRNDVFGYSVAISGDGNTLIVGAPNGDVGANANQGSATVFIRTGSSWSEQQTLTSSSGAANDFFGYAVALSNDGNTAAIGASQGGNLDQGSVTVFTRIGSTWSEQQTLTQSDGAGGDRFGGAVALSSDGNTILIGASYDTVGSNSAQGSATVFTRTAGVWTQQQTLTLSSGGSASDRFGISVALSSDGNTALIGAHVKSRAVVFTRTAGVWSQQQSLSMTGGEASSDFFGVSVALSSDGNIALIGASLDNIGANADQGSAVIFTRTAGVWTQQQMLTKSDGTANDSFGNSVALSANGNIALVAASYDAVGANTNQGSVTIFIKINGVWTERQIIISNNGTGGDSFGNAISLSSAGNIAIIGVDFADISGNTNQGSALVFYRR